MTGASSEESRLRAYLLGELPPEERVPVEERLLMDRDFVELLLILEEELTDGYLRGVLSEQERNEFENYFLTTPARRRKLKMARVLKRYVANKRPELAPGTRTDRPSGAFRRRLVFAPIWGTALAAMLVAAVGIGIWRTVIYESTVDKGLAALRAYRRESPVEGRVSGFDWGPRNETLGDGSNDIPDRTKLDVAGRYLSDAVNTRGDADSHHALGKYYLVKGDLDAAIAQFYTALESAPKNAKLHSDLGVALLERGRLSREGSSDSLPDFAESLVHLDEALKLDPALLEALFNRALCHEHMNARSQAADDWKAYLERDGGSLWREKARRHLLDMEDDKKKTSQDKEFKESSPPTKPGMEARR